MRILPGRLLALIVLAAAAVAHAQWLNHPTPGIPRNARGEPDLTAPAPRTPDGRPDFTGVWAMDGGPAMFYLPGGLKPDEMAPSVGPLLEERAETFGRDDQQVRCLPEGPRFNHFLAIPKKIVQTPSLIVVLSEDLSFRQIFLDGRPLPKDPSPSFMGYSVGRWDGDTLVVETVGFKETTWLDFAGSPHSEALRTTERWRRTSFGTIEIEEVFEDPVYYRRPLRARVTATLVPDTELLEFVCAENERDVPLLVGTNTEERKAITPVTVAPEILAQYVGDYDFRWPENPTVPSLWPVTMSNGGLFLQGAPLTPLSENEFLWAAGNRLRFVKDDTGRVTHFVTIFVEGDMVAKKVPAAPRE